MLQKDIDRVYNVAKESYNRAKESLRIVHKSMNESFNSAISDVVPGYEANRLNFGNYTKDNFAVLFVDMRSSTKRAIKIGPEQTFLTMHVYIPALLEVVKIYNGNVIDIMGDGIMVFFGGSKQRYNTMTKAEAIQNVAYCSLGMMTIREKVINKILNEENIQWANIDIGIGITYGDVVVTKIGVKEIFDVKAFGNCINKASKYSDGCNQIHISDEIHREWPTGKDGTLTFFKAPNGDGYIVNN